MISNVGNLDLFVVQYLMHTTSHIIFQHMNYLDGPRVFQTRISKSFQFSSNQIDNFKIAHSHVV